MNRNSALLRCAISCALALALLPAPAAAAKKKPVPEAAKTGEPKQAAKVAKGSLFAIVLGPGSDWKKGQPLKGPGLPEHRRYWAQLHDEGRIASAGPLGDDAGLILLRAKNLAEANAAITADPAVKARLFRGVARPYAPVLANPAVLEGKGG